MTRFEKLNIPGVVALLCCVCSLTPLSHGADNEADEADAAPDGMAFFTDHVEPILREHCFKCHSHEAGKSKGGLMLDSRSTILTGGSTGPAVTLGDSEGSLLIQRVVTNDKDERMPPEGKLSRDEVDRLRAWIGMGMPAPKAVASGAASGGAYKAITAEELWSLQPVRASEPPSVKDGGWPLNDVDRFVLARLEGEGLRPVGDASPQVMLRRVHFTLTGLPPTPQDVQRFVADPSREALAKVIDELLASPRFGERWARHWFDTARYADSNGGDRDRVFRYAWRYRNWVIDAINADKPYDRFLAEQIAGDLMPADDWKQADAQQVATGYLALGTKPLPQYKPGTFELKDEEFEKTMPEWAADQIAAVMRGTMGLTVDCARCHDHKFDPIPTRDYYALAGIFYSTDLRFTMPFFQFTHISADDYVIEPWMHLTGKPEQVGEARKLGEAWLAIESERREPSRVVKDYERRRKRSKYSREEYEAAKAQLDEIQKKVDTIAENVKALTTVNHAMGARDADTLHNVRIQIRGEYDQLGDEAPRGFLTAIDIPAPWIPADSSGRLELAQWITHADNPLTARVAVNRVWYHLFGRGIVDSLDNFGATGSEPTHPQLLDYLAHRFVHTHGWSTKKLIRELMLSRVFALASTPDADNMKADPNNELLWRYTPRRLEAEAIRDAMLAVSGRLDVERPKGSPVIDMKYGNQSTGRERTMVDEQEDQSHRGVYLPIVRTQLSTVHSLFDLPETSVVSSQRTTVTVPTQGLYLMNSPWVRQQASEMAKRLMQDGDLSDRVRSAYLLAFGVEPSDEEVSGELSALREAIADGRAEADAWSDMCHSLLLSGRFLYVY